MAARISHWTGSVAGTGRSGAFAAGVDADEEEGKAVNEEAVAHKKEMSTTIDPELEITKETYDIN